MSRDTNPKQKQPPGVFSIKKAFLKISQNSEENTFWENMCNISSLFNFFYPIVSFSISYFHNKHVYKTKILNSLELLRSFPFFY